MPTNNASLDHFLHRLQGQDAVIGTASGEIPVAVSIELTRLYTEINQLHPGLLAPFNANGNAVALKSQISTAASKLTALAASPRPLRRRHKSNNCLRRSKISCARCHRAPRFDTIRTRI